MVTFQITDFDGLDSGPGLITSQGRTWKKLRKTAVCSLHEDNKTIEYVIQDQVHLTIDIIDQNFINTSTNIDNLPLTEPLVSCLWKIITQDSLEESQLKEFSKNIFGMAEDFLSPLVQVAQHNRSLLFLSETLGLTHQVEFLGQIQSKIKEFIFNSNKNLDSKSEVSPLVKALLHGKDIYHNQTNVIWTISDLLLVGSYTLWVHLQWGLICLIKYPNWQQKIRQEFGQETQPLTDAFISEVLRTFVVQSKGLSYPMVTADDVQIEKHFLPKGTGIIHMLSEVMGDPKHFPNPRQFDPTRFVTYENNDVPIDTFHPRLIPFGVGKRRCIGENIAKWVLKTFLSQLVVKYDISSDEDINVSFNDAAIAKPTPFNVIFKPTY